jgi:hypothetical protein
MRQPVTSVSKLTSTSPADSSQQSMASCRHPVVTMGCSCACLVLLVKCPKHGSESSSQYLHRHLPAHDQQSFLDLDLVLNLWTIRSSYLASYARALHSTLWQSSNLISYLESEEERRIRAVLPRHYPLLYTQSCCIDTRSGLDTLTPSSTILYSANGTNVSTSRLALCISMTLIVSTLYRQVWLTLIISPRVVRNIKLRSARAARQGSYGTLPALVLSNNDKFDKRDQNVIKFDTSILEKVGAADHFFPPAAQIHADSKAPLAKSEPKSDCEKQSSM